MGHNGHMLLGVDIGFGDVKATVFYDGKQTTIKFPTAISPCQRSEIRGLDNTQDQFIYKSRKFLLSYDALFSDTIISTRSLQFLKEFTPIFLFKVLVELSKELNIPLERLVHQPKKICLGLPLEFFFLEKNAIRGSIETFMVTYILKGKSTSYTVSCPNVDVRAQGQGVMTDFLITEKGLRTGHLESNVLVVDIGFNTVDVLSFIRGRASSNGSYMMNGQGVCRITRELGIEIKQEQGVTLSEQKLKEVLRTRQLKIKNQDLPLNSTIDMVVTEYVAHLIHELETKSQQTMNDAETLIVAGGGAYYLSGQLKSLFTDNFLHIPGQPEFANARGYMKKLKVVDS
ncbi:MAG: ParM/StbA family protein [Proteobacteria bacterium]|nr:ParM/StbA family protein [Pseudomonadota bacterium]